MDKLIENNIKLYKGNDPATIAKLLKFQKPSIVNKLKALFNANSLTELSVKLSIGK